MSFLDSTWAAYGDKPSDPAEQARVGMTYMKARYGNGGYIPGSLVSTYISPDECIIRAADVKVMRLRCSRPGHPTATSDCGKPGAIIEPPEETT